MAIISDEYFREMHNKLKDYTIVLIKPTPKRNDAGADAIIFEHARKNLAISEEGLASIICPVFGGNNLSGVYIFNVSVNEVQRIMDNDPAVKAGIFIYEIYPCKGFPGASLA
ncbi:MAG: hypothetical protein FWG27_03235 [Treponema sp.]|jgi:hypothetical protein|nr:hypothetical protein [Treponema sp.]